MGSRGSVRGGLLLALLALLPAACAGGGADRPSSPGDPAGTGPPGEAADPVEAMADLDLSMECDRLRVTAPERMRGRVHRVGEGSAPPYEVRVGSIVVRVRELPPEVVFGGEDLSIVAEGIVKMTRTSGRLKSDEGPYGTVVIRNGRMMAR